MRSAPSYGIRGKRSVPQVGARPVARTFAEIRTYVNKANGHITVESDAERLVAHILSIDPRVRSFTPQPFTVDLVLKRLLFTPEDVSEARKLRGRNSGAAEYTPDFSTVQTDGLQRAYEIKSEGYEGDSEYWSKVDRAAEIMEAYCYPLSKVVVPADVCEVCRSIVTTTLVHRDVAFGHQLGTLHKLLVGVCDKCDTVVSIPSEATPATGVSLATKSTYEDASVRK